MDCLDALCVHVRRERFNQLGSYSLMLVAWSNGKVVDLERATIVERNILVPPLLFPAARLLLYITRTACNYWPVVEPVTLFRTWRKWCVRLRE